jgi:two-component system chemotaxis response regulator CheB
MTLQTRVVVVDDSDLGCALLSKMIEQHLDIECVGMATDANSAHDVARMQRPDVILLAANMRRIDSPSCLTWLRTLMPTPVVLVVPRTERAAEFTMEALETGTVDFVTAARGDVAGDLIRFSEEVACKIRVATCAPQRLSSGLGCTAARFHARRPLCIGRVCTDEVIFIGAASGGIQATREVLANMPPDAPAVLVALPLPPGFTRGYVSWLNQLCRMTVIQATDGGRILPGHVYLPPDGMHLMVESMPHGLVARVRGCDTADLDEAAANTLFASAARVVGSMAIGVMLTGEGSDGVRGMKQMHDAGSWNVAQDKATSISFDMPGQAIEANAVDQVVALPVIAQRVIDRLRDDFDGRVQHD